MINTIPQVLVADDSRTIATALEIVLRRAGFEVTTTHSGEEALQLAERMNFDLVISDHQMLEMSGVELCAHLRGIGRYRATPFVLLTARGDLDEQQLRAEAGVTCVLAKPFRPSEVAALAKRLTQSAASPA